MAYNTDSTMYQGLEASIKARGDADCIYFFGAKLNWNEFGEMVDNCAAAMVANGVKAGDRVTICTPNIPQGFAAIYATNKIGAICNMLHPLSVKSEAEHAVNLTGSKFAFCFDVSERAFDGMPITLVKCRTNTYFEKTPIGYVRSFGYKQKIKSKVVDAKVDKKIEWTDFMTQGESYIAQNGVPETKGSGSDTAAIMFTGGTTGLPKGVMLSNMAINTLAKQISKVITGDDYKGSDMEVIKGGFDPDKDCMLTSLPVFHGFGFGFCMHTALIEGIPQAIFPQFDAKVCSKAIKKHKINFIFGVPDFFEKVYKAGYLDKMDMSNIKLIGSGGDVVPATLVEKYDRLLKKNGAKVHFVIGYGLTECVTCCTFTHPNKEAPKGCVGHTIPDAEAMLVKVGTTEPAVGEDGELCITGKTLMQGYYHDPEETAKMLVKHDDGRIWLHTGDMCYMDENNDIYYRQRLKRVFKISGYLVYPSFIEEAMRNMDKVYDCCVIGVDKNGKTELKLYVVKHKKAFNDNEEELTASILAFANEHLSKWSVPKSIEYIDALPRTKIGKVDFKVLQAMNE